MEQHQRILVKENIVYLMQRSMAVYDCAAKSRSLLAANVIILCASVNPKTFLPAWGS